MRPWFLVGLLLIGACADRPRSLVTDPSADHRVEYTVKPGDTWSDISELFFADPSHAARLAQENDSSLPLDPTVGSTVVVRVRPDELPVVERLARARDSYNLGTDLFQQNRLDEARAAFERALEIAPEFLDARYNLGLVYLESNRPSEALEHLRPVVEARPGDVDAAYALGATLYHRQDYGGAVTALERVLQNDPDFLRARFTLAMSLERLGRVDDARAAWQAYLDRDSTSAWANEARSHLDQLR